MGGSWPRRSGSPSASGSAGRNAAKDPGEIGVIIYGPNGGRELTPVVCKPPDGEPLPYDGRMSPLYRVGNVEWKRGPKSTESPD